MTLCIAPTQSKPSLWQRALNLHPGQPAKPPQQPWLDLRDLTPLSGHLLRDIGLNRG